MSTINTATDPLLSSRRSSLDYQAIYTRSDQSQYANPFQSAGSSSQARQNAINNYDALLLHLLNHENALDFLSKESLDLLLQNENMPESSKEKLRRAEPFIKYGDNIFYMSLPMTAIAIIGICVCLIKESSPDMENMMKFMTLVGVAFMVSLLGVSILVAGRGMRRHAITEAYLQRSTTQRLPV